MQKLRERLIQIIFPCQAAVRDMGPQPEEKEEAAVCDLTQSQENKAFHSDRN